MLVIDSVTKNYSGSNVLENICVSFTDGKIIGLLGPNGAGKTTLLRILSTILRATSGKICYKGNDIEKMSVTFRDSVGYMPEDGGLYLRLTPVQNLKFYMGFYSQVITDKELGLYLEQYKLQDVQNRQAGQLSKGTKQKILFLKSLINNPEVLILDEPLTSLDPEIRVLVKNELKKRKDMGHHVVLSSHSLSEVEDICDTIMIIKRGKVLTCDSLINLKNRYAPCHPHALESIYLKIIEEK